MTSGGKVGGQQLKGHVTGGGTIHGGTRDAGNGGWGLYIIAGYSSGKISDDCLRRREAEWRERSKRALWCWEDGSAGKKTGKKKEIWVSSFYRCCKTAVGQLLRWTISQRRPPTIKTSVPFLWETVWISDIHFSVWCVGGVVTWTEFLFGHKRFEQMTAEG